VVRTSGYVRVTMMTQDGSLPYHNKTQSLDDSVRLISIKVYDSVRLRYQSVSEVDNRDASCERTWCGARHGHISEDGVS
jgi:hypothetical protein